MQAACAPHWRRPRQLASWQLAACRAAAAAVCLALCALQAAGQGLVRSSSTVTGATGTTTQLLGLYKSSLAWAATYKRSPSSACSVAGGASLCASASAKAVQSLAELTVATSPAAYDGTRLADTGGVAVVPAAADQQQCNTCAAFAAAAAASAAIASVLRVDARDTSFSVQSLYYCSQGGGQGGPVRDCLGQGMSLPEVLRELTARQHELPIAECMPYTADPQQRLLPEQLCKAKCTTRNAYTLQGTLSSRAIGEEWLAQQHIRRYGGVVSRFEVYDGFREWGADKANAKRVYAPPPGAKLLYNHAVLLVGYELLPQGGHWLVLNSWGSAWGDNGLFRVALGTCGVLTPGSGEAYGVVFAPTSLPDAALLPVQPVLGRTGCFTYTARPGDHLSRIAWLAGMDLARLLADNTGTVRDLDEPLAGTRLTLCDPAPGRVRDPSAPVDPQLEALLRIKAAVDRNNVLSGWTRSGGAGGGFCSWKGVVCSIDGKTIERLNLFSGTGVQGLVGVLPPAAAFKGLSGLTTFDLSSQPGIGGPLPADWSSLRQLEDVRFGNSSLTGTLPASWSALTRLRVLYAWGNKLSGPLPEAWSALKAMEYLEIGTNRLDGTLPGAWKSMVAIRSITLGKNKLNGPLPDSWASLKKLDKLWLHTNQLTGPLPETWKALTALSDLRISFNALSGTLPAAWGSMAQLKLLYLNRNQLTGPLPEGWSAFREMENLGLSNNDLSGTVPASWGSMTRWTNEGGVRLAGNPRLSGCLPAAWRAPLEAAKVDTATKIFKTELSGFCRA